MDLENSQSPPTPGAPPVGASSPPDAIPPGATATDGDRPGRRRFPIWAIVAIVLAVLLFGTTAASVFIHVPYSTISPGAAVPLTDLVHIDRAQTFPKPRGDIRLLFVRERNHISLLRYVLSKFDDQVEVFKEKQITGGQSPQQQEQESRDEMDAAKVSATKVALGAAGYKVPPPQSVVESTDPTLPAAKVLRKGDVLLTADGKRIAATNDLRTQVAAHAVGDKVVLGISRDGVERTVPVAVAMKDGRKVIGVTVGPKFDFPVNVSVDTAGIGGPSGGLAMTLAILDDLTPGNLTGGHRVAVTGTIDPDGKVGEIGGIEQKAIAARAAHAQLFIVPECSPDDPANVHAACEKDLQRAVRRAGPKVKVRPVGTFAEALALLREEGGDAVVKTAPGAKTRNAA